MKKVSAYFLFTLLAYSTSEIYANKYSSNTGPGLAGPPPNQQNQQATQRYGWENNARQPAYEQFSNSSVYQNQQDSSSQANIIGGLQEKAAPQLSSQIPPPAAIYYVPQEYQLERMGDPYEATAGQFSWAVSPQNSAAYGPTRPASMSTFYDSQGSFSYGSNEMGVNPSEGWLNYAPPSAPEPAQLPYNMSQAQGSIYAEGQPSQTAVYEYGQENPALGQSEYPNSMQGSVSPSNRLQFYTPTAVQQSLTGVPVQQ